MRIELCKQLRDPLLLAEALRATLIPPAKGREIGGIATSSGEVEEGDLFVAFPGERCNGWEYAADALDRGAAGILAPQGVLLPEGNYARFLAKDPAEALIFAAGERRRTLCGQVIAIGGSAGKTTLKEAVYEVLSEVGVTRKNEGNYNSTVGMPLSLLSMEDADFHVLEIGVNHCGEMETLSRTLSPHLAVLTNIGSAHVGKFGSFEKLAAEKGNIAAGILPGGVLILPEEAEFRAENREKIKIYRYGTGMNAAIRAENIRMSADGVSLDVLTARGRYEGLFWGIPGRMGMALLLMTAGVAAEYGVGKEEIGRGLLRGCARTPRMQKIICRDRLLLCDAYNASPESVITALESFLYMAGDRRTVAVLGDILELGVFSPRLHEKLGESVSRSGVSVLVTYGREAERIAEGARCAGMRGESIFSFGAGEEEELAKTICTVSGERGAVLFKASHRVGLERVARRVERILRWEE